MTAEVETAARRAGVVGWPIGHSLSPVLHRAAYRSLGLSRWTYHRNEVRIGELSGYLDGLDPSWVGVSVTMPAKEEALERSHDAGDDARLTGSANTLLRADGGWWADNTDIDGLRLALAEGGCDRARVAWLIGSGATARSALVALARLGLREVIVQVRSEPRQQFLHLAQTLGLGVRVRRYEAGAPDLTQVEVAVSAVPAVTGMSMPVTAAGGVVALDVVYASRSSWTQALTAGGAVSVDGSVMLLHQAARQVELMTGRRAPVPAMRAALESALRGRAR